LLEYARFQPFLDQPEYPSVSDPALDQLHQTFRVKVVK